MLPQTVSSFPVNPPPPPQEPHVLWRCCPTESSLWPTSETPAACCATRMGTPLRCRMTTSRISSRSARGSRGQVLYATRGKQLVLDVPVLCSHAVGFACHLLVYSGNSIVLNKAEGQYVMSEIQT